MLRYFHDLWHTNLWGVRIFASDKTNKNNMIRKYLPLWALALTLGLQTPAMAANAVPANPTDLTYAAENAVNSVVYIKVTTNSKTQTVEYSDPFG